MDYYETNAKTFVESTLGIDMQPLYQHFLPLLPDGADILDVGCGSGRDSRYFITQGYRVTAFDASPRIAALAEKEVGQTVAVQRVQDIQYQNQFHGIWACASLLHVPTQDLHDVFHRLSKALKSNGLIYCSFKYGRGEMQREGRCFTDLNEYGLRAVLSRDRELAIEELWVTSDRRPGRSDERWLNATLVQSD